MLHRSEKIKLLHEQAEITFKLYNALNSCPEEQRSNIQAKVIEADTKLWELYREPVEPD